MLVGDSTVNDQGGWGPGFRASFGPPVECLNLARNGRSSKSFRDEGAWAPALAAKPRYVLIQFGHNDNPGKGPERETDPDTTYRANMARYVDESRGVGATPILVTSIVRRNFEASGKIKRDQNVPYVAAVRKLAVEKNAPLIDLYAMTLAQAEELGPAGSAGLGRKASDGKLDRTHLGSLGQRLIGNMAARELTRIEPALKPYLHEVVAWKDAPRQPPAWHGSAEKHRAVTEPVSNLPDYRSGCRFAARLSTPATRWQGGDDFLRRCGFGLSSALFYFAGTGGFHFAATRHTRVHNRFRDLDERWKSASTGRRNRLPHRLRQTIDPARWGRRFRLPFQWPQPMVGI